MQLKTVFTTLLVLTATISARAQDKIYKADGDSIIAKVKVVSTASVTYVRFDNINGPEYSLSKSDVARIKYANGSEDVFDEQDAPAHSHVHDTYTHHGKKKFNYKNNVISFSPFQFTENGIGVSLSYERSLGKEGKVAFYMPVIATFNIFNQNDNYNNNSSGNNTDAMFYAMPGLKFYPTGNKGRVKYSIGPNLVLATGKHTDYNNGFVAGTGNYAANEQQTRTQLGIIITNYVNFNPSAHVTTGFELGMGTTYINRLGGVNNNAAFLIQGAFKIGYRF